MKLNNISNTSVSIGLEIFATVTSRSAELEIYYKPFRRLSLVLFHNNCLRSVKQYEQNYYCGTCYFLNGDNYANSEHALTICSQYKEGNEWKYDKKIRVGINQTLNDTNTTFKSSSYKWRVYLKPYAAWQTGCNGEGYIWYDM